jgi:hypothetical protein
MTKVLDKLIAAKVPEVIKKTRAIEVCVNSIKSEASDSPIIAEKTQKVICAAEILILFIRALK